MVQLWFWGGVVLSAGEWDRFWQVFVMKGVDNVCCNRDRWQLFNLVLANLERMSTLMLSVLGMCWQLFNLEFVIQVSYSKLGVGFAC